MVGVQITPYRSLPLGKTYPRTEGINPKISEEAKGAEAGSRGASTHMWVCDEGGASCVACSKTNVSLQGFVGRSPPLFSIGRLP